MKGKIIPLKPQADGKKQGVGSGSKARGLLAAQMHEVERLLWRASARAPGVLRERLIAITEKGERLCPALFLIIASAHQSESRQRYHLAASLEALHLALRTHRGMATTDELSPKEAILCGDFYFGLALTLAGNQPLFIQGMSEIITRFVASTIEIPGQAAASEDLCKDYLQKICDGMASIYALSCTLGAWLAGLKPWQNEALSYYGLYLGIGLQVKQERESFTSLLREKEPLFKASLPILYTLGESPLRPKLASLLNKRLSEKERDLFLREVERINPCPYLERIINNCFFKAGQFIELLWESVDPETLQSLKNLLP